MVLKEIEVLRDSLLESERFIKKLKLLIKEVETEDTSFYSSKRASVKRSALDLRKQLALITTVVANYSGDYHYKD